MLVPMPTELPVIHELPVFGGEPQERSDAARNRRKVLEAASRLFECHGAANVSMDAVAAEAGVGKGTLFRRFGDRASLARAVLEQDEIELQDALIRGPAPLGPGAAPYERLRAFGRAYLEFLEGHGDLILAAEFGSPGLRFVSPVYAFYRTHVTVLLNQAGLDAPADYLADVLLAPLSASTFRYHRVVRGLSVDELATNYTDLVARLLDSPR
jgi:AcrR family transcriptional regulator